MPVIDVFNVSKVYTGEGIPVTALHPTTLSITHNDFACISGPSGSGKTTLLNIMGGIDTPSSGRVMIGESETGNLSRTKAAQLRLHKLGFIFQSHNLIPVLTAYENVEYVLLLQGLSAHERREKTVQALQDVGLADHMTKKPGQLSGGQQQRVAIARAVVSSPSIVLADEPTASLDSKTGQEIMKLLRELNSARQTTFVFSSHDPRVIQQAKRLITLEDGRIVSDVNP